MSRSYAVVGAGSVGGYYGARLQQAGHEVHFLLHSDYDPVRRHGLVIRSCDGDFRLPRVNAYADPRRMPRCDVTIVALKSTHNHLLPAILPHLMPRQGGVALLLQNGLNAEPAVARLAGPRRVMSGLCFVCINRTGPGRLHHLDYGRVTLADYRPGWKPAGITHRMRDIGHDLETARIPVSYVPDLWSARWQKLAWNIPFNGLSVLFNATTRELLDWAPTAALARSLMLEVIRGGRAAGAHMPRNLAEKLMAHTRLMKPYATSMLLDYQRKRPMEIEAIYGEPLRTATRAGCPLPLIQALYPLLTELNASRQPPPPPPTNRRTGKTL